MYQLGDKSCSLFPNYKIEGGADMALNSGKHVGQLRDEVASPGGTTIAGIRETEKHGLRSAIIEAVIAAAEKSKGN